MPGLLRCRRSPALGRPLEPLSLRELLVERLAGGTQSPARVLAALAAVAPADPESPPSLLQLLAALDQQPGQSQALTSLRHDVVTGLVRAAPPCES